MVISLADAQVNSDTDVDYAVIDEFRKADWFIDNVQFDDAAVPGTGGGTTSYGYTRVIQERGAKVRDYNTEAEKGQAKRKRFSVDLLPMAGSYDLDRTLAHLGQRTTDEVAFQSQQAIKSVRALFNQSLIEGAANSDDSISFDGLDAALTGSSTEQGVGEVTDWSAVTDEASANDAIDTLDNLLSLLDGDPTAILTNRKGRLRLRSLARRAGYYERTKDDFGRAVESYAGIPFVDFGAKSGSSTPVIPTETRTINTVAEDGLTDFYVVRLGLDGLHGVSMAGAPLVQTWLPDFSTAGAVKTGEVELGPVSVALKATKAAAVLRNVRV